jgi:hypothetical protein
LPESTLTPQAVKLFSSSRASPAPAAEKKGHCSPAEFARWAKYQVALHENDWKRVGSVANNEAASEE